MEFGWVMSKSFVAPDGKVLPTAYSYGTNFAAADYQPSGWGLVWLMLEPQQIDFIKSGTDPDVEWVGDVLDAPTPLVLSEYADQLGAGTFTILRQVLAILGPFYSQKRDLKRF